MRKKARKFLQHISTVLVLIFLLTATPVVAQIKSGNLTQFTEQDGLPGSQVNNLIQDKFGYIWIGTINGLARFDGYEFKRFYSNPNDTVSIRGLIISSVFEDSEGRVWAGSSPENLNVYNPVTKSFRNYPFKHLIDHPNNFEIGIYSMCEDKKDRIYLGVSGQWINIKSGLLYYDKKDDKIKRFITPDSLNTQNVYKVISGKTENIWLLTHSGFLKIDADRKLSKVKSVDKEFVKANDYFTDMKSDKNGHIWLTTYQSRLFEYNPENESYQIYSPDKLSKATNNDLHYTTIAIDKNDEIWIGTTSGLQYFDRKSGRFEVFDDDSNKQLAQTSVNELKFDSFGSLWIGTTSKGLFKYEERALLKSYSNNKENKNSITPGWVNTIYESTDGKIWITTSGQGMASGISLLNPLTGSIQSWPYNEFLREDYISGLMEISPDEFYISTYTGLHQFSPKSNTLKKVLLAGVPDSLFIYQFYRDTRENLWLCTIGGLFRKSKNDKTFRRYDLSKISGSNSSNEITHSFESKKHGLWLLTNFGLFLYNYVTDKIERHGFDQNTGDIFISQDINSLYEDDKGTVWVGTWQGGLSKYNAESKTIKTYTRNDGLPSMSVQGILADEKNNYLWLSTFEGLSRFNTKTEQFNNFSIADGIQGQLFADGAYLKTSLGQFIFGGSNGITIFNSNDVNTNSTPPLVFLPI